jgi:hypothetical protein
MEENFEIFFSYLDNIDKEIVNDENEIIKLYNDDKFDDAANILITNGILHIGTKQSPYHIIGTYVENDKILDKCSFYPNGNKTKKDVYFTKHNDVNHIKYDDDLQNLKNYLQLDSRNIFNTQE